MSTGSIRQSRTLTYMGNNSGVTWTQYLWISSELQRFSVKMKGQSSGISIPWELSTSNDASLLYTAVSRASNDASLLYTVVSRASNDKVSSDIISLLGKNVGIMQRFISFTVKKSNVSKLKGNCKLSCKSLDKLVKTDYDKS